MRRFAHRGQDLLETTHQNHSPTAFIYTPRVLETKNNSPGKVPRPNTESRLPCLPHFSSLPSDSLGIRRVNPSLPPSQDTPRAKNVPAVTPCDACAAVDVAFFLHRRGHPAHQLARRTRRFLPRPPRSCVTLILVLLSTDRPPCVWGRKGVGLAGKKGRACMWMRGLCGKGGGVGSVPRAGRSSHGRRGRHRMCFERACNLTS